jgi:hypothetical protein
VPGRTMNRFRKLLEWDSSLPFRWVCRASQSLTEFPRRYLSDTIFNVMFGFEDSISELGEESVPPQEEALIKQTIEILERRHQRDYPPGVRPMLRDFHGKAHACLAAKFKIEEDLPAEVRYGIFRQAAEYDAVVRFSNGSRTPGSDRLPNQHGMAIKVILKDGRHQDFILSDFPVNFMANAERAFYFYRADAAERHFAYFVRHPASAALLFLSSALQPQLDLFEAHYFSQTPYRLGPKRACKYIARPAKRASDTPERNRQDALPDSPNYLRWQMEKRLANAHLPGNEIQFQFYVQPQRHPIRQPVEDSSFRWSEREAPPIHVATITIVPSSDPSFTSPEAQWHAELIAFSPERGLEDHEPIGGLNRVRKAVYRKFAEMRFRANGVQERSGTDAMPPGTVSTNGPTTNG